MSYYYTESPLLEALVQILGAEPPFPQLKGVYSEAEMGEYPLQSFKGAGLVDLAEWCGAYACENGLPACWTTGSAIVEAAELMVFRAVDSANILPPS